MLEAEHFPPASARRVSTTERKAWGILFSAFMIFCLLASATAYGGYHMLTAPAAPTVTVQNVATVPSSIMRAGSTRKEVLTKSDTLAVGDRIIVDSAPAGIGARLHTGGATIGLWPESAMLVDESDGRIRLRLESGQALIELTEPRTSLRLAVTALPPEIELTGPGLYRLRWLSDKGSLTAVAERSLAPGFELTTDQGTARIGEISVPSGQRYIVDGTTRTDQARWPLLRDGDFSAFSLEEYLATLGGGTERRAAETWRLSRLALAEGAKAKSGLFFLNKACETSVAGDKNCRNVMRFARLGGNEKDSHTGMTQEINADVTSYQHVTLSSEIRVDFQSLSKGGADGTECPLLVRIDYSNKTGGTSQKVFCFWAFDDGSTGTTSLLPWIKTTQISQKTWYHFSVDLNKEIPDLQGIQQVTFYSNGHDYDASIAHVSLVAQGLTSVIQP